MALKIDYDNSWIENLRPKNYATGNLPSAGTSTKGSIYCDSTLGTLVYDNGSSVVTIATGSGGITGTLTSGEVVYATGSGTVDSDAQFKWSTSTKTFTLGDAGTTKTRMVHGAGTLASGDNGYVFTGTLDATLPTTPAWSSSVTGAGTYSSNGWWAHLMSLEAGYTGSHMNMAANIANYSESTGTSIAAYSAVPFSAIGLRGISSGSSTTTGYKLGVKGHAISTASGYTGLCVGVSGSAQSTATGKSVGVMGSVNTGSILVGGFFGLSIAEPTLDVSAALIVDSSASGPALFLARDAGSTVFTIADGGAVTATGLITASGGVQIGTFTPSVNGQIGYDGTNLLFREGGTNKTLGNFSVTSSTLNNIMIGQGGTYSGASSSLITVNGAYTGAVAITATAQTTATVGVAIGTTLPTNSSANETGITLTTTNGGGSANGGVKIGTYISYPSGGGLAPSTSIGLKVVCGQSQSGTSSVDPKLATAGSLPSGTFGIYTYETTSNSAYLTVGTYSEASNDVTNFTGNIIGLIGKARTAYSTSSRHIGVLGSGTTHGVYAYTGTTDNPTLGSSCVLTADSGDSGKHIFQALSGGSIYLQIDSSGALKTGSIQPISASSDFLLLAPSGYNISIGGASNTNSLKIYGTASYALPYFNASAVMAFLANGTTGQYLAANTSSAPSWASISIAESAVTFTDITTNNVTSTKHGYVPKSPGSTTQFLRGDATPAWSALPSLSTIQAGIVTQAPNNTTQFLRGDATWATPASTSYASGSVCGGYVVSNGTTAIYLYPDKSNVIYLNNAGGTLWSPYTISDASSAFVMSGLSANTLYYVYAYQTAGTVLLEMNTTAPTTLNNIKVKTGDYTRLLVAYARTTATVVPSNTTSAVYVCNVYNKRPTFLYKGTATANWTFTAGSWRVANPGDAAFMVNAVNDGITPVRAEYTVTGLGTTTYIGMAVSTSSGSTTNSATVGYMPTTTVNNQITTVYIGTPGANFYYFQPLEVGTSVTFIGTPSGYGSATIISLVGAF